MLVAVKVTYIRSTRCCAQGALVIYQALLTSYDYRLLAESGDCYPILTSIEM